MRKIDERGEKFGIKYQIKVAKDVKAHVVRTKRSDL